MIIKKEELRKAEWKSVLHIVQERFKYLEVIHTFMNTIYAIETLLVWNRI